MLGEVRAEPPEFDVCASPEELEEERRRWRDGLPDGPLRRAIGGRHEARFAQYQREVASDEWRQDCVTAMLEGGDAIERVAYGFALCSDGAAICLEIDRGVAHSIANRAWRQHLVAAGKNEVAIRRDGIFAARNGGGRAAVNAAVVDRADRLGLIVQPMSRNDLTAMFGEPCAAERWAAWDRIIDSMLSAARKSRRSVGHGRR